MAIPVLLWGAAAALGATGLAKGAKACIDISDAKEIGENAERRYKRKWRELKHTCEETNEIFDELGKLKAEIFQNQIAHIVKLLKQQKSAGSTLKDFQSYFDTEDLVQMEKMVQKSLELTSNLTASVAAGAFSGLAVYGSIPLVATASTGTAIASLSGAAATNATLAWLGGGSLAAGGFGMAGGMAALAGIVAAPALAVGGFMLAGQAEEQLTKAREYRAEVDVEVAMFEQKQEILKALQENAGEVAYVLKGLVDAFEEKRVDHYRDDGYRELLSIGRALKDVLDTKIMEEDGSPVPGINHKLSGYLEI